MTIRWTDSHCHLPYERLDDPATEIERAAEAGVTRLITVGTDLEQSRAALAVASGRHGVWATIGLHPHDATNGLDPVLDLLDEALADPDTRGEVVAVGECGLDYHYDHSPRNVQREVFAAQVQAAHDRHLALVVHTREAWDDTFAVLDDVGLPEHTVFHCFTGGPAEAEASVERGGNLSFSGIVTFPNADDVRVAAQITPLDRLLVETDAPYLTPVPHRGKPNRPAWVTAVGASIAETRGTTTDAVAEATWANTARVFGLPPDREG